MFSRVWGAKSPSRLPGNVIFDKKIRVTLGVSCSRKSPSIITKRNVDEIQHLKEYYFEFENKRNNLFIGSILV